MNTHRPLALLVATVALGGCGGSGSSNGSGAATDPHLPSAVSADAHFVGAAETICQRLITELSKIKLKSLSPAEIARVIPGRAPAERRAVEELGKLARPPAAAASMREVIRERTALAAQLEELEHAAKANDTAAINRLATSKGKLHRQLLASAEKAGIKTCGQTG